MARSSSDELYWRLMLEGMRPRTVGAVEGQNEKAGRSRNGAARQGTSDNREESRGYPTDEPSPARQSRPVLAVVSSRERGARIGGTPPSLTLIVGGKR